MSLFGKKEILRSLYLSELQLGRKEKNKGYDLIEKYDQTKDIPGVVSGNERLFSYSLLFKTNFTSLSKFEEGQLKLWENFITFNHYLKDDTQIAWKEKDCFSLKELLEGGGRTERPQTDGKRLKMLSRNLLELFCRLDKFGFYYPAVDIGKFYCNKELSKLYFEDWTVFDIQPVGCFRRFKSKFEIKQEVYSKAPLASNHDDYIKFWSEAITLPKFDSFEANQSVFLKPNDCQYIYNLEPEQGEYFTYGGKVDAVWPVDISLVFHAIEYYALEVILFKILVGKFPYEGRVMASIPNSDEKEHKEWLEIYHKNPYFIFDENDTTNHLGIESTGEYEERWTELPQKARTMFQNIFREENSKLPPDKVVYYTPQKWKDALFE